MSPNLFIVSDDCGASEHASKYALWKSAQKKLTRLSLETELVLVSIMHSLGKSFQLLWNNRFN